ncbi:MAG: hypothetical protein WCT05_11300 [Lentisphaeria bacterium]
MNKKIRILLITLLASLLLSGMHLQTPTVALKESGGQLRLQNCLNPEIWENARLGFSLYDGKRKEPLTVLAPEYHQAEGCLLVNHRGAGWEWKTTFEVRQRLLLASGSIVNSGKEDLWLEAEIFLQPDGSTPALSFWEGSNNIEPLDNRPVARNGVRGKLLKHLSSPSYVFSASGVAFQDSSLFLGHVTFDPVSYSAATYDPGTRKYAFSQRLVISPGQSVPIRFVIGVAANRYGVAEGIVQQYFDSLPECWVVSGGQENPYVWGNMAHYQNWWGIPKPEESRRLRYSIEWCYCPYKRSGDIAIRPEFWDYTPHNPYGTNFSPKFGGAKIDFSSSTRDEFLAIRKERFLQYGRRYGWMFYNSCAGTWCEFNLAREHYADSINTDTSAPQILNSWSTGHDREIRVFPMGTCFAKALEEDMVAMSRELDLPGFALDCGSGGVYFRGEACTKPLLGRAWDDKGVFIDQGVAVNHQVDFIHNINTDKPLTVFTNGYLKGDLLMLEVPYVDKAKLQDLLPLYRWYIGPRPGCVHGHGFLFENLVPGWRNRSREQFLEIMGKLSDYIILNQFKYGLSNSYVTFFGCPQQVYIIPEALEIARCGWQAEIPMRLSPQLYAPYQARYGKAEHSFLFLANSRPEDSSGKVSIDNRALSPLDHQRHIYVRKMRDQASLLNQLEGDWTHINIDLPSRMPVLLETVCGLETDPAINFSAEASSRKTLQEQRYTVRFQQLTSGVNARLRVRNIYGFELTGILLNGKSLDFKRENTWTLQAANSLLLDNHSELEILYRSKDYAVNTDTITSFPFTDDSGNLTFSVRMETDDPAAKQLAQLRFAEYFDFCREKKLLPDGAAVDFRDGSSDNQIQIALQLGAGNLLRAAENGNIRLEVENQEQLNHLLDALFAVMDQRFEYIYPFRWVMGLPGKVLNHFKMTGKHLPYVKYFEEEKP